MMKACVDSLQARYAIDFDRKGASVLSGPHTGKSTTNHSLSAYTLDTLRDLRHWYKHKRRILNLPVYP